MCSKQRSVVGSQLSVVSCEAAPDTDNRILTTDNWHLPTQQPPIVLTQGAVADKESFRHLADQVQEMEVDGVICYEDYTAMGLILELLTRGIRVPDEIAVAGFDDLPIGKSFSLGVTTYALSADEITRRAFELMEARIRHPERSPIKIVVPGKLIVRESTAGKQ